MSDVKLPAVRAPNPWDYRAQVTGEIAAWAPPLMSADRDAMPGFELNKARARDLVMSNPFAVNAAEISRDAIVGRNFALALDPDWEHVGASAEAAEEWQRIVEAEWRRYAEGFTFDVDATRKCTFTFLMHQVQFGMHVDGEVLAAVRAKLGETGYVTCLQLIEPERLDRMRNFQRRPDQNEIRMGVERDEYGEPIAYWILNGHRSDAVWSQPGASTSGHVERFERTINGRPTILHVFDEPRPQMTRGVSLPMLTTLRSMKMLQTFGEAELSRQIQSASYAAVIESEMDYEKAMRLLGTIGGGADVNALTQAQRHGFGRSGNVHARQQLVDDLDLAARARAVAQLVDLGGHRVQKRLGHGIGRRLARRHHGHLATGGFGGTTRDGRVHILQAHGLQPRLQGHRPVGVHGGAHHEHAAGLHAGRTTWAGAIAKQHAFGLCGIDHDRDDHVTGRAQRGQGVVRHAAVFGKCLRHLAAHIEHLHLVSGTPQRSRHARAHGSQTDQTDCAHVIFSVAQPGAAPIVVNPGRSWRRPPRSSIARCRPA